MEGSRSIPKRRHITIQSSPIQQFQTLAPTWDFPHSLPSLLGVIGRFRSLLKLTSHGLRILVAMAAEKETEQDQLAEALNHLFTSVSDMIKGELQGSNNALELLEEMNVRVAEEYKGFGDVALGLRVFVEQLKSKSATFDHYIQQLDAIDQQVTEFKAVISMLDKYVTSLESKMKSVYQVLPNKVP